MLTPVALRQARRDRQLVSKRLLLHEDEDHTEISMDTASGGQVTQSLNYKVLVGLEKHAA